MNQQFRYLSARFFQAIFYPVFLVLYNLFFDLSINGKENLKNINSPVIFISNHISAYDSFIFDLFVSPFSRIPPFRFMGTTNVDPWYLKFMKYTGLLYLVYLFFGVIKVTYGKGAEIATAPAANIIEKGGTVVIFPEGKIWVREKGQEPIGPFRWGAAILAANTGAPVIPVSFRRGQDSLWRRKLTVNIGKQYNIDLNEKAEVVAHDMRRRVLELYNKE